ncbi:hypothetical protein NECAME_04171, partial [Necator americanus]
INRDVELLRGCIKNRRIRLEHTTPFSNSPGIVHSDLFCRLKVRSSNGNFLLLHLLMTFSTHPIKKLPEYITWLLLLDNGIGK